MKKVKLGDYVLWNGKLHKVSATCDYPQVMLESVKEGRCPHCDGVLEANGFWVVPTSPLWDESASAVPTIID